MGVFRGCGLRVGLDAGRSVRCCQGAVSDYRGGVVSEVSGFEAGGSVFRGVFGSLVRSIDVLEWSKRCSLGRGVACGAIRDAHTRPFSPESTAATAAKCRGDPTAWCFVNRGEFRGGLF